MLAETQGDSQETTSSPYIKVIILKNMEEMLIKTKTNKNPLVPSMST